MTKTLFLIGWLAASTLIAGSALRGQEAASQRFQALLPAAAPYLALRNAQTLWQKHCETCHGASGRGDGPNARLHEQRKGHAPRNLTNPKVQQNLTDGDIFWRITKGIIEEGNNVIMPRYEEKIPSETDRWQLVLFVRELGPARK